MSIESTNGTALRPAIGIPIGSAQWIANVYTVRPTIWATDKAAVATTIAATNGLSITTTDVATVSATDHRSNETADVKTIASADRAAERKSVAAALGSTFFHSHRATYWSTDVAAIEYSNGTTNGSTLIDPVVAALTATDHSAHVPAHRPDSLAVSHVRRKQWNPSDEFLVRCGRQNRIVGGRSHFEAVGFGIVVGCRQQLV